MCWSASKVERTGKGITTSVSGRVKGGIEGWEEGTICDSKIYVDVPGVLWGGGGRMDGGRGSQFDLAPIIYEIDVTGVVVFLAWDVSGGY